LSHEQTKLSRVKNQRQRALEEGGGRKGRVKAKKWRKRRVRRAVQDKSKEGEELAGRLCGVSSLVLCSSGSRGHCPGAKGVAFDQRNLKVHNHIADCQADAGLRERCQSLEQFEYSFSAVSMRFKAKWQEVSAFVVGSLLIFVDFSLLC